MGHSSLASDAKAQDDGRDQASIQQAEFEASVKQIVHGIKVREKRKNKEKCVQHDGALS